MEQNILPQHHPFATTPLTPPRFPAVRPRLSPHSPPPSSKKHDVQHKKMKTKVAVAAETAAAPPVRTDDPRLTGAGRSEAGAIGSVKLECRERSRKYGSGHFPRLNAARAHDAAALAIKGQSAYLNFPHLAHELPRPASVAPKDIQAAAAKAAALSFASTEAEPNDILDSSNSASALALVAHDDDTFYNLPDLPLVGSD